MTIFPDISDIVSDLSDVAAALWDAIDSSWGIEIVMLLVGLAITYGIVDQLLKRAEGRRWESTRSWVIQNVHRKNQIAILIWVAVADRSLIKSYSPMSDQNFDPIVSALRNELEQLGEDAFVSNSVRTDEYWLNVARGLGSSADFAANILDRADLALRDDPELLAVLLKLDEAHKTLGAFRSDDENFGKGKVAVAIPSVIFEALSLHLKLWDLLWVEATDLSE